MAAAADSTTNKPTTESTQQPAEPTRYPLKGNLEKLEAKCLITTEEFILSTQKPNPNQSMKESLLAPAACKESNIGATPHTPSSDHHNEHMRASKGYVPPPPENPPPWPLPGPQPPPIIITPYFIPNNHNPTAIYSKRATLHQSRTGQSRKGTGFCRHQKWACPKHNPQTHKDPSSGTRPQPSSTSTATSTQHNQTNTPHH